MKKIYALVMMVILCAVTSMPLMVQAQSDTALQHRAEISRPVHFDKTPKPLREMFDTGETPKPARGGRDFEPGRPQPVEDINRPFTDPLADKSVGATSTAPEILASVVGVPIDPNARVAPPDTTGDVGPNHYVQWVNLRYSIYTLTRGANNEITAFNLVAGFPKNGNVVWQGFGGRCQSDNDGDPIVQYDQLADRWVLTQFAVGGQPVHSMRRGIDESGSNGNILPVCVLLRRNFNDYPKMGVWPDAYYISYNMFRNGRSFTGNTVCAFERAQMLVGGPARQACVNTTGGHSMEPADLEGTTLPPAGSPNLLLSITYHRASVLALLGELGRRHRYIDWANRRLPELLHSAEPAVAVRASSSLERQLDSTHWLIA